MNGNPKFRKPTGPAFAPGEHWKSISGNIDCWIVKVEKYPRATSDHISDYGVTYRYSDGTEHSKDAWSFQVRYEHTSDTADLKEYGKGRKRVA